MQYILLFLEGIITFISPCLLPMLPIYISYFSAGKANKKKAFLNSIGFVCGFTFIFVIMGAFMGIFGKLLREYAMVLNLITGLVVIVFGLNFMGVFKFSFLNRTYARKADVKNLGFFSSVLLGIVFAISWTPCVGFFLGSALLAASVKASLVQGITMLLAYSLGLGIPFIASAVLLDQMKDAFSFIKRNYRSVNMAAGGLLVVVGLLMATGYMGDFLSLLTF